MCVSLSQDGYLGKGAGEDRLFLTEKGLQYVRRKRESKETWGFEAYTPQEELEQLKQRIGICRRGIDILEMQKAQFGPLHVPPYVIIGIELYEKDIAKMYERINELEEQINQQ